MYKSTLVLGVVALGSVALAATMDAQAATTPSPFHAGQWGIDGYAAAPGSGGVTRFFTPRTALVLGVTADHIGTSADASANAFRRSSATTLDLDLGLRHHTMVAPKIASTFAGGLTSGTIQQRTEYADPINTVSTYHATYVGAFVELGGQYMITEHLAVGFAYGLTGRHLSLDGDRGGWEFAAAFRPVRASLYF